MIRRLIPWLLLPLALVLFLNYQYDKISIWLCFVVVLIIFGLIIWRQQHSALYKGIWYRPSLLFLLCYCVVSFQYVFDLLIGFKGYADFLYPNTVNDVTIVCTVGIIGFVIGYGDENKVNKNDKLLLYSYKKQISVTFLVIIQVLLFVSWLANVNLSELLSGNQYITDGAGSLANNLEMLFYDVTLAILVTIICNSSLNGPITTKEFIWSNSIISWIVILLYCIIRLISGDRGPCLFTLLALFYSYIVTTKHRVSAVRLVLYLVIGAFAINIVGIARTMSLDESFSERVISSVTDFRYSTDDRFSDRTISPLTEELALSSRCNQIAIDQVKYKGHQLHFGRYFFYQLLQCIPFVPSLLANTLNIPQYELSANIYMTDIYAGRHDLYQIGTTITADSYFDLGVFGVFIMLLILGRVYRFVDYSICVEPPKNWVGIIIVLLISSMSIYIPRSTFIIQFKNIIPVCVFFILNQALFTKNGQ